MVALEDHDSVSAAEFEQGVSDGAYAITWEAHGLRYGLPAGLWDEFLAGRVVVFNTSRAIVQRTMEMFPGTQVVLVEATAKVRAKRLGGRGRENEAQVAARLAREVPAALEGAIRVDNSGDLKSGVAAFIAALRAIAQP
jgi:ribose 1,5-bisphosphokinase